MIFTAAQLATLVPLLAAVASPGRSLPFPAGTTVTVLQAPDYCHSHSPREANAIDLGVPVGTTVVALRGGRVVELVDGYGDGGPERAHEHRANQLVVDHGDGTYGLYQHLARGSARVAIGAVVAAGDALATVGMSGMTSAPHLHLAWLDGAGVARPLDPEQTGGELRGNARYVTRPSRAGSSSAAPRIAANEPRLSPLPRAVFAEGGLELSDDTLTRLLPAGATLHVRGRAVAGEGQRVALIVSERTTGAPVRVAYATVGLGGRFRVALDTRGLAGPYGLVATRLADTGGVSSREVVPIFIAEGAGGVERAPIQLATGVRP